VTQPEPVKILMVDDQPSKLLAYEVILRPLGETLLAASSAGEALGLLLKHDDVAVVLIDVQMPDLDGFELATMIREHPRYQDIALIFVSAVHLSDLDRIKGYESGCVDYVPVPVVPEVLRAKVRVFADLFRKTRALERLNLDLEARVSERTAALEASRAELETLNHDLEARIEERTQEHKKALAQLFESQKLDTIGQLTGGVAHDFNNLLMAMIASLELLKKRAALDDGAQKLLDNAMKGAERGAALTQRLLAFARRQELRPEAIDLPVLVASMRELLQGALGPRITLVEEVAEKLPPVLADANQLELALMNLALNGRDAMHDGGVLTIATSLEIVKEDSTGAGLAPGHYLRLTVSDTGHGMDEATLARATEPFFTTKGAGKGTGLGLPMVQGLAAQSGGALRIQSRLGQGCSVHLLLPEADLSCKPASGGPIAETIVGSSEAATILLVDDDTLVSVGTVAMLEDLGHRVIAADSAAAALDLLEKFHDIDLVITDHVMPEMTGLEFARIARQRRPDLPIVLATGYADLEPATRRDLEYPRLAKPYFQSDLARLLSQLHRGGGKGPRSAAGLATKRAVGFQ
jgi:signal transduction histidine kinase